MYGRSVVMKSAGTVSAAELSCHWREDNTARKEHFSAEWKDLSLSSRPEQGCSLREVNDLQRETYSQQRQTQFLVQRSPWNIMKMGRLGDRTTEYHLPYQRSLPVPIFKPMDLSTKVERVGTPPELRGMMEFERALSNPGNNGLCQDKKMISEIKMELPPVMQPVRLEFGNSELPRSLSRSMSHEAQRG
ncbi:telethonin-like [Rhinatrema bivittatum]|uniref:telethonin-like n=1 Tax=Rhinatrema bivittatum TaxID=194408 RepID=UPI00112C937A|nr:telethonin-like [Rhinatrema bivittatum]